MTPVKAALAEKLASVADRVCGGLISKHYHLSKLLFLLYHQSSLAKPPLLVYQMGKVGSTTLINSLRASDVSSKYSIYHVHWLSPDRLRHEENIYRKAQARCNGRWLPAQSFYPHYVWLGQSLSKQIRKPRKTLRWTIITLLREPIARNISSFFQNLETLLSYDYRSRLQTTNRKIVLEELRRLFYQHCLENEAIEAFDANPLTWFDKELKEVFGLDVYAHPFSHHDGHATYDTPRARVLLLRLEDFSRHEGQPVKTFLQSEDFKLFSANTGRSKEYAGLYADLVEEMALPLEFVERVYQSKYATHFYTPQELEAFKSRWAYRTRPIGDG